MYFDRCGKVRECLHHGCATHLNMTSSDLIPAKFYPSIPDDLNYFEKNDIYLSYHFHMEMTYLLFEKHFVPHPANRQVLLPFHF